MEPFQACESEQQIINTLATKVMGWDTHTDVDGNEYWIIDGKWFPKKCWNPLHNIADAWMIVQQMAKADPVTSHKFQEALSMYCIYDITPERICRAAWQSLNTPVKEARPK